MKKIALLSLLALSAGPLTAQQINGTFDDAWEACETTGQQPAGWKSANINEMGQVAELVRSTDGVSGNGVLMTNEWVGMNFMGSSIGQNAPGYLSLGTPWNTAKISFGWGISITNKDGGSYGGIDFTYRPDAVRFSYKRSHASGNQSETASVIACLWKGQYSSDVAVGISTSPQTSTMIDREKDVMGMITDGVTKSADAECIATINYSIEGDQADWKTLTIPFNYTSDATPEKINVIFSSADYFGDRDAIGAGRAAT